MTEIIFGLFPLNQQKNNLINMSVGRGVQEAHTAKGMTYCAFLGSSGCRNFLHKWVLQPLANSYKDDSARYAHSFW